MKRKVARLIGTSVLGLTVVSLGTASARAQTSSFYGDPARRAAVKTPLTLSRASAIYLAPTPPRQLKLNDIITVIVDYKSQVISEGEVDRKKKSNFKAALSDWILIKNMSLIPDPQSKGDPKITGSWDNKFRGEGSLESRDAMEFKIACRVVDIRPNGHLVLEGRRVIRNNNDVWRLSLGGTIRAEDVLPNNTVLSQNIANLRIDKDEAGSVRDAYRRGWLLRWLDTYQLF